MAELVVVAVVGTLIAVLGVIFIVLFVHRVSIHTEPTPHVFFHEPTDVYREELNDSFMEQALWRCGVCHFRNHPERKLCDLCQTLRGQDKEIAKQRFALKARKMHSIGESEPYPTDQQNSSVHLSKLQLAASRRQQWKRMPTNDGLHRWVRQSRISKRESIESNGSATGRLSQYNDARESNVSVGYIRVRDSVGRLVLNESELVATDFHYRINILDGTGTSELIMNLEGVHNLPFTDKLRWFSTEIHRLWLPWESGHSELVVRREHTLEDSFNLVRAMKPYQLRQRWRVVFAGEPGLDAGGVMREWFTLLFSELFDPKFGLFVSTVGDERCYWLNTYSADHHPDHLDYFEFAGRLLGKAILEEHLATVHLALPFLKHILGVPISFSDLQFLDDEIYNSAMMIKNTDDLDALCLDFTVTRIVDGKPQVHELVEGGASIDVTAANKKHFLDALFKYYVLESVSDQVLSFLTALYDVVPEGLLKLFDYQELELLMCGVPSIDVEDWKKHTDYKFFTHNYPTELELNNICWFWEVMEEMKNEDRVRLLQFATGSSRVPAQGFKGLISSDGRVRRFNIAFAGLHQPCLFPKAHTCFNRLDLPTYISKATMTEYLKLIVAMDITGFTIE
ncbi:TPA: hypothetical protein N0F65_009747 [Lagenidium giganteum]|uniref:HECT-type E3 ubiquitin transferase n=1 Tax=Lagenidium giganteum TaxID=4803 RepID=A0AAV2YLU5_9STRA|nr:TPA: hypothetical protein N0F65_009747 [Lagenidium giganteum]